MSPSLPLIADRWFLLKKKYRQGGKLATSMGRAFQSIAYSPRVQSPADLPREGWDEWYIFEKPTELGTSHIGENIFEVPQQQGHVNVFVNYCLALHRPEMEDLVALFWKQMEWIQPESYVADNDYLNFVSSDKNRFAAVHDALKALT